MEYLVIVFNTVIQEWEEIGTSPTPTVSDFWIAGRLNYLAIIGKGPYSSKDVLVIKKEDKEKYGL